MNPTPLPEKVKKEYWLTPPEIYKALDREFHFDMDPCPYPFKGVDGIDLEWGFSNYVNPPFNRSDEQNGRTMTDWVKKSIEESKKGKTVVLIFNTSNLINMLIEAGAEMRSMGRVKWLDGKTKDTWKSPSNTTLFILRGRKKGVSNSSQH